MYGYVRPPLGTLSEEEQRRFRAVYCGLCRELGERYGLPARMILNYDFTYLAVLLSDGTEGEADAFRCPRHPLKKQAVRRGGASMEIAADESVILAYWQLRDGVEDHGFHRGLKYRAGAKALRRAYAKAAKARPGFDQAVRKQLQKLSALERERSPAMDAAADAFATLLAGAAGEAENPVRRRVLGQLLYHLGRWIYLVDAADDLQKDARSGNYNPVALRYGLQEGRWTGEGRKAFAATLDHSIHMMQTAYELWDFGVWGPLLEKTLYTGLYHVGGAVLNGTFHDPPRGGQKDKKVEETT